MTILKQFKADNMYGSVIECEEADLDKLVTEAIRFGYMKAVSDENKSRVAIDWEVQKHIAVTRFFEKEEHQ